MNYIDEKYWNLITKSLSKNLSYVEEIELNEWLAKDPSHSQLLQELEMSWFAADQYGSQFSPNKERAWAQVSKQLGFTEVDQPAPVKKLFPWIRAAAAVFLILIGIWFIWRSKTQNNWIEVASDNKIKEVILPDNSKVWLSQNSSIRYQDNMNENDGREVILEGEAFFEVTHNPTKPFIVQALETETKVLGTSFNVLARKNVPDILVSVVTGRVEFKNSDAEQNKLILEPGTQGTYTKATAALTKKQTTNHNFLFWKNKQLDFSNVTVRDALNDIEKSYGVHFSVKDSSVSSKRITTSFQQESIEQIIAELSVLLDVEITKSDTTYLVQAIK